MRACPLCLLATLSLSFLPFEQGTRPVPPGLVAAEKSAERSDARLSDKLPQPVRPGADPAKLQADAAELSRLADSVPAQIDQVTKGRLPKDLGESLKRIEKLAKHLRSQLSL